MEFILRALDASGVNTSAILREPPPTRTTLAFVEVSEDGDRDFTFYRSAPAADELLAPDDITPEGLSGASFANFGSIPLLKDPVRSATQRFAALAGELGVAVAFDVNLRAHLWDGLDAFRETVEPLLGTGDPAEGAEMLLDRGASLVLVSMAGAGALYATPAFQGHVPAFVIEDAVDATGAGDAFLAAVLTHLSESAGWIDDERAVREAVRRGTAAGALACTQFGAMGSLPTRMELERFIAVQG